MIWGVCINCHWELSPPCPWWVSFLIANQEGKKGSFQPLLTCMSTSGSGSLCQLLVFPAVAFWRAMGIPGHLKRCSAQSSAIGHQKELSVPEKKNKSTHKSASAQSLATMELVSPTRLALQCPQVPLCLIPLTVTVVVRNSWEYGNTSIWLLLLQNSHEEVGKDLGLY